MDPVLSFIYNLEGAQKLIAEHLHNLITSYPEVVYKIRYRIPFYYRKSWICYVNPIKNGGIELAFVRANELSNENGNPQFTKTIDITVIWPNGAQASREGQKIREWIEGFGSGNWSDNVFEVSGYWSTTFVNGNTHSYTVGTPLRREAVCYYFVSGTIDVVRTNFSGVFDYGVGECDNMAAFTFANGTTVDIVLN